MSHFQDFSYSATKYFLIMLCCNLTLFYAANLNGQGKIFSEAPIVIKDGGTFSTMLYVKFNDGVIDLAKGIKQATIANINISFPYTIQFFKNLEAVYDSFTIYKAIPSAVWNENIIINRSTGKAVMLIDMSQLFIIGFPKLVPISQIISDLELLPEVAYAHPPIQAMDLLAPDDYYYGNQWNLPKIDAPKAWDVTTGNSNVRIGIIEAHGVKRDHEDFFNLDQTSKFVAGKGDNTYDLDYDHGTMVAGIVGAATNNNKGVASLGWNIRMIPYHWTGWDWKEDNVGNLPSKIHQAAIDDSVSIINMSFETIGACDLDLDCTIPSDYPSVMEEILNALKAGVVVVAAGGNLSINKDNKECNTVLCPEGNVPYTPYPASYYFSKQQYPDLDEDVEVIGVSATDQSDVFTPGFNCGNFVDLSAPGMFIWTTRHDANGFPYYNNTGTGTSLATPHVAALAGLILSINPDLSIQQVQDIMEITSKDLGAPGWDQYYGHGRINAYEAILLALSYNKYDLSGTVTYYNGAPPVNDAIFTLIHVGGKSYDTTDANGYCFFEDISRGSVNLGPSKSGDLRDAITGSDALLLLRYLAFLVTLTEDQKFAADVTEDGSVTGSDAQALLRYLAFYTDGIGSTGQWRFDPSDTAFMLLEDTETDFKAFLLGDVTGFWASISKADSAGMLAELEITIEAPDKDKDGLIEVPVKVSNVKEPLNTFLLSISYDSKYFAFQETKQTELTEKFMAVSNGTDPGIVHLAMAGISGIKEDGEIVRLLFKGEMADRSENDLALKLTRAIINDYDIIKEDSENISLPKRQAEQQLTLIPNHYSLDQNYPNPFNPTTTISYQLPAGKDQYFVTLKIYDALGRLVKVLVEQKKAPGIYQIVWDGTDVNGRAVASGIYFYSIQVGDFRMIKKMGLMR